MLQSQSRALLAVLHTSKQVLKGELAVTMGIFVVTTRMRGHSKLELEAAFAQ